MEICQNIKRCHSGDDTFRKRIDHAQWLQLRHYNLDSIIINKIITISLHVLCCVFHFKDGGAGLKITSTEILGGLLQLSGAVFSSIK